MAVNNILKNAGDTLIVEVKPKANGDIRLSSYTSVVLGENAEHGIIIEYRIAEDELFYEEWVELTNDNISGVVVKQGQIIQVRYTRISSSASGDYEFKSIDFDGDYTAREINMPTLSSSIFSEVAWNEETEQLARNLFKKFYFRGIIPKYITRAENVDKNEDEDFIILYKSVAFFYAIFIKFFKRFENLHDYLDLLRERVRQYGIQFNESEATVEMLQKIVENIYNEIEHRGTLEVLRYKGDERKDGSKATIDGELIRLIRSNKESELLYEYLPIQNIGWCLGVSSPMYRSLNDYDVDFNKTKEKTLGFQSVNNFTHWGGVSIVNDGGLRCLQLSGNAGLGRKTKSKTISEGMYVADPKMDYEIVFSFKVVSTGGNINIEVEGFDRMKNKLNDAFVQPTNATVKDSFLNRPLTGFVAGKWYRVHCIISAYYSKNKDTDQLNLGYGNNLYFNNPFVKYIIPRIYITSGRINIYNYKIRPLVRGTNLIPLKDKSWNNAFSMGFIQSDRIFHLVARNNNNSQSLAEITDIIERYLLPYSMTDITTFISNE